MLREGLIILIIGIQVTFFGQATRAGNDLFKGHQSMQNRDYGDQ